VFNSHPRRSTNNNNLPETHVFDLNKELCQSEHHRSSNLVLLLFFITPGLELGDTNVYEP